MKVPNQIAVAIDQAVGEILTGDRSDQGVRASITQVVWVAMTSPPAVQNAAMSQPILTRLLEAVGLKAAGLDDVIARARLHRIGLAGIAGQLDAFPGNRAARALCERAQDTLRGIA